MILKQVCRIYNAGGFIVKSIHADNEFKPLIEELEDELKVTMKFAPPQGHVPEAERNNRTIKERVRIMYHRNHFQWIPPLMIITAVMRLAATLNFFPPRGGCSNYYSPRTIIHQEVLDYKAHCQFAMWSYVLATNDDPKTKNTNAPRKLDCIYLRPVAHGGVHQHELLHINTGQLITRSTAALTKVPLTSSVIQAVHVLADQQKAPNGLKIKNKTGQILWDSAWTAGVEYDPDTFEPYNDEEQEEYDDSSGKEDVSRYWPR